MEVSCFGKPSVSLWVPMRVLFWQISTFYRYESTFVSRVRAVISLEAARFFRHTFRLIDDVLSLDHPEFKGYVDSVAPDDRTGEVVGGIYPQQLRIAYTNVSTPKNTQFLDMDVKDEGLDWCSTCMTSAVDSTSRLCDIHTWTA